MASAETNPWATPTAIEAKYFVHPTLDWLSRNSSSSSWAQKCVAKWLLNVAGPQEQYYRENALKYSNHLVEFLYADGGACQARTGLKHGTVLGLYVGHIVFERDLAAVFGNKKLAEAHAWGLDTRRGLDGNICIVGLDPGPVEGNVLAGIRAPSTRGERPNVRADTVIWNGKPCIVYILTSSVNAGDKLVVAARYQTASESLMSGSSSSSLWIEDELEEEEGRPQPLTRRFPDVLLRNREFGPPPPPQPLDHKRMREEEQDPRTDVKRKRLFSLEFSFIGIKPHM